MNASMSPAKRGWAVGLTATAALLLILAGAFQFFQGLAAVIKGSVFVASQETIYKFNVSTWGWIHLVIGVVVVLTGFALLAGATWARVLGIVLAILAAVANFLWIPYQPIWAILVIILDVAVIWALTVVGTAFDES
jgi:hypothetical protein